MDSSSDPPALPPKVYRAMKRDPVDNLPVVGSNSSTELGARVGVDIFVDSTGLVILDGSGMSVSPSWRNLKATRIPRRLRHLVPGAKGSDATSCYTLGMAGFQRDIIANGLELIPDAGPKPITHGVIAPVLAVPVAEFMADIANTRSNWQIDEL